MSNKGKTLEVKRKNNSFGFSLKNIQVTTQNGTKNFEIITKVQATAKKYGLADEMQLVQVGGESVADLSHGDILGKIKAAKKKVTLLVQSLTEEDKKLIEMEKSIRSSIRSKGALPAEEETKSTTSTIKPSSTPKTEGMNGNMDIEDLDSLPGLTKITITRNNQKYGFRLLKDDMNRFLFTKVDDEGVAQKAGVHTGDELIYVNGTKCLSTSGYSDISAIFKENDEVTIYVKRAEVPAFNIVRPSVSEAPPTEVEEEEKSKSRSKSKSSVKEVKVEEAVEASEPLPDHQEKLFPSGFQSGEPIKHEQEKLFPAGFTTGQPEPEPEAQKSETRSLTSIKLNDMSPENDKSEVMSIKSIKTLQEETLELEDMRPSEVEQVNRNDSIKTATTSVVAADIAKTAITAVTETTETSGNAGSESAIKTITLDKTNSPDNTFGFKLLQDEDINAQVFLSVDNNSPAECAGLDTEQALVQVNGEFVNGFDQETIIKMIKESGNHVALGTVARSEYSTLVASMVAIPASTVGAVVAENAKEESEAEKSEATTIIDPADQKLTQNPSIVISTTPPQPGNKKLKIFKVPGTSCGFSAKMLHDENIIFVDMVERDSPAFKAGLLVGDQILGFGTLQDLVSFVQGCEEIVELEVKKIDGFVSIFPVPMHPRCPDFSGNDIYFLFAFPVFIRQTF